MRILGKVRGFLLSYGPTSVKKIFWDKEFASGKWNFIDDTAGDCVYAHLERHAAGGDILDLGCGPGNTANELLRRHTAAMLVWTSPRRLSPKPGHAPRRTAGHPRTPSRKATLSATCLRRNSMSFCSGESMYHVPINKVKATLDRFAPYLKDGGLFVVRMFAGDRETGQPKARPMAMFDVMEKEFDVVEKKQYPEGLATVLVFRPKSVGAAARTPQKVAH